MFGKVVQVCRCRLRNSARVRHDEPRTIREHRLRRRVREPLGSDKPRVLRKVARHVDPEATNAVARVELADSAGVLPR